MSRVNSTTQGQEDIIGHAAVASSLPTSPSPSTAACSQGLKRRRDFKLFLPSSLFASDMGTRSTQAIKEEEQEVEAPPPHVANRKMEETRPCRSPQPEVAALNHSSRDESHAPSGVRSLFRQETLLSVEAVRSTLWSGTRTHHTLGLPRDPSMTAVEGTWEEFRSAHAAATRVKIRRLENEICVWSSASRELNSMAEDGRRHSRDLEARQAANIERRITQFQEAVVQRLLAEEAAYMEMYSDRQRAIATMRAQVEELKAQVEELKRKNPHGNLSGSCADLGL